jgi:putative hydrolase of the HAD superfamily
MPIKHLVIDLGGVLVELDWDRSTPLLYPDSVPEAEAVRRWVESEAVSRHETGSIDAETFYSEFAEEYGGDRERVEEGSSCIIGNPKSDCESILETLSNRFQLSMLSNISRVHTQQLDSRTRLARHFPERFLSWELGCMKPDAAIYAAICDRLSATPSEIAFFDDRQGNVDGAIDAGMQAWRVDSPADILSITLEHEVFR